MLNWIIWNKTICIKMDLVLNSQQILICHKTLPTKWQFSFSYILCTLVLYFVISLSWVTIYKDLFFYSHSLFFFFFGNLQLFCSFLEMSRNLTFSNFSHWSLLFLWGCFYLLSDLFLFFSFLRFLRSCLSLYLQFFFLS